MLGETANAKRAYVRTVPGRYKKMHACIYGPMIADCTYILLWLASSSYLNPTALIAPSGGPPVGGGG